MTRAEALKVWRVVRNCDGGCPTCVGDIVDDLEKEFPGLPWRGWFKEWREGLRWTS